MEFFDFIFSAGVGRTGTYIAVDIIRGLINQSQKNLSTMKLDVMGIVYQLRQDRGKMVQTKVRFYSIDSI
jgi:protein tyrosine phosphatase